MTEYEESFNSGQQEKTSKSKYRFRRICAVIILFAFVWWFNNYTLKITEISIESPKIKTPVRIAAISDLHASSHGISSKNIIKKIKKSDPDIVFILGDMYTSGSSWDKIQIAVDLTECGEVLQWEESPHGQRGVSGGSAVPLGQDQAVPVRVPGVFGVDPHLVKVEDGQNFRNGKRSPNVSGVCVFYRLQAVFPDPGGNQLQLPLLFLLHM